MKVLGLKGQAKMIESIPYPSHRISENCVQEIDKSYVLVKCSHSSIRKKETKVSYCEIVFTFFFHFLFSRLSEYSVLLNMQSIQIGLLE